MCLVRMQSNLDSQESTSTTSLCGGTEIAEVSPNLPLAARRNEDPIHEDQRATSESALLPRNFGTGDASVREGVSLRLQLMIHLGILRSRVDGRI